MAFFNRRSAYARSEPTESRRGGILRFLLVLALLAWCVRSFLFAPFSIPSGSMLPALFIGDYIVVHKWPYGVSRYSFPFDFPPISGRTFAQLPERGDVVVFRHPDDDYDLVKRVIGLPGDTVELRSGELFLNGQPLPREPRGGFGVSVSPNSPCRVVPPATPLMITLRGETRCMYPIYAEALPGGRSHLVIDQVANPRADDFPATKVPPGHLFLMGDNRDDSLDSRYSLAEGGIGFVPMENLVGRASFIFWSTDGSASYWKPWTWFSALRGDRVGQTVREAR